jgi:hypothetical protein
MVFEWWAGKREEITAKKEPSRRKAKRSARAVPPFFLPLSTLAVSTAL